MVQVYSTKRQRETDERSRGFIPILVAIFIFCVAMFFLTGCGALATKEERLASACYHSGGKASVSYNGDSGRVECR
jgi:hypothetical protein